VIIFNTLGKGTRDGQLLRDRNHFSDLAARIEKLWASPTPLGKTFVEIHGWQHLPLTPNNIADLASAIGDRFKHMSNSDPDGVNLEY